MKSSDLKQLLLGISSGDILKVKIEEEVTNYRKLLDKKGSSVPIIFNEDEEILLDNAGIQRLLEETLSGRLSNVDLAYICDCLTLADKVHFKDEYVEDIVFEIADTEIPTEFKSDTELRWMIDRCKQQ